MLATGPAALVQDLGRPGRAAVGVSPSGAADRAAFRLGARLLAQDLDAAALEVTFGGLVVRAHGDLMVVLTGAEAPADLDGRPVGYRGPFVLYEGGILRLRAPRAGVRSYLSVRGGIEVSPVLGSRSTDTLSGLGPPRVADGDRLPVGPPPARFPQVDLAPGRPPESGLLRLRAWWGPRDDWLADRDALAGVVWTVSARSDRVGLRLEGAVVERATSRRGTELPSEGLVRGAVQAPPDGRPVIFLADHPVTGGYPVVAVLTDQDADRAAQARPGQPVRFDVREPS